MELIHGDIVFSSSSDKLEVFEDSIIAVENGAVEGIYSSKPERFADLHVTDYGRALIIPAFSDLHIHAPQYSQRGNGMDLLLPNWLAQNTFPEEAKFSSEEYAENVYSALVDDMIKNGTFHACVFASLHKESALLLADIMEKKGMHGFVGKVNMDVNSPSYLCETVESSLRDTEDFICGLSGDRSVRPILTPRFAPTCSRTLLEGLGKLGRKYGCGMQTHLVESRWEAAEALKLFPDCSSDAEIYEKAGLLDNGPTVFAHFIFPMEEDIRIAKKYNAYAVHCPEATNNIIAGIMPAGDLIDRGITVASGTDIGAGSRVPVFSQLAAAIRLSKLKEFYEPEKNRTLLFPEAFHMATKEGGSLFGKYGSFENGYVFDALVIDGLEDPWVKLSPEQRLERFCYNGDDRNITARYINGRKQ
jgi:Cytosine deaminase and related metal-dependent hydrolases